MNKYIRGYRCTVCGKFFETKEAMMTCPDCGEKGILDVEYDYEELKNVLTKEYFEKNRNYSMWRYAPLMGIEEMREGAHGKRTQPRTRRYGFAICWCRARNGNQV